MKSKPAPFLALLLTASMVSACGGGGSGGSTGGGTIPVVTPTPTSAPTASPTSTPISASNYTCPSSDSVTAVAQSGGGSSTETIRHIAPNRGVIPASAQFAPGLLAVSYTSSFAKSSATAIAKHETTLNAQFVKQIDFSGLGRTTRVLRVNPFNVLTIAAQLRAQEGVQSVSQVGLRRPTTVTAPYLTNDPYFKGFNGLVAPYYENASTPGQWDMHAIELEHAFAYSQAGDVQGGVSANANALGSSSVKIAIIDTGEDTGHPELHSKIVYQKCFITNPSNVQSTSNFTTDPDGHGTDVSGIAADDINNSLGFVGTGGNVDLYAYRVFPTPDSYTNCGPGSTNTSDDTCTATTVDIADAINDAVSHGVNVISMSLGGGTCSGGSDPDPTEGSAIANAISHNVIVVAAAGNGGSNGVDAPGCDSGVIAVGASALGDGQANGTNSIGSSATPVEYVASYSQYGTPGKSVRSSSAWGIVAPGGDPNSNDSDELHWIENIWTSIPYDPQDAGTCTGDYPTDTGTTDCRILIAGTSMATPHVAGAVGLIESVTGAYSTPSAMKQLLCQTADDINDPHEGCGRLNIYRAMAKAMGDPNLP